MVFIACRPISRFVYFGTMLLVESRTWVVGHFLRAKQGFRFSGAPNRSDTGFEEAMLSSDVSGLGYRGYI